MLSLRGGAVGQEGRGQQAALGGGSEGGACVAAVAAVQASLAADSGQRLLPLPCHPPREDVRMVPW